MNRSVLLCDDDVFILRAAEIKLRRAGYDVRTAADGEEGWEMIRQRPPDLLVTDCQMPRLDGFGLVRRVREDPTVANLPILMLTAKGFELNHEAVSSEWNVTAVVPKPFSPRELLKRVDAILDDEAGEETCRPQIAAAVAESTPCDCDTLLASSPTPL